MRNTTPEESERFRHTETVWTRRQTRWNFLYSLQFLSPVLPVFLLKDAPVDFHWACSKHACQNSSAEGLNRFTFSQVHIGGSAGWVVGVYLARWSTGSSRVSAGGCIGPRTQEGTCCCLSWHREADWLVNEAEGKKGKQQRVNAEGSFEEQCHIQQCQWFDKYCWICLSEWRSVGSAGSRGISRGSEKMGGAGHVAALHLEGGLKSGHPTLTYLLLPQARTLYIVLMLLFNCLADGHTAAARITLPQIHQILWLGIKSGVQRVTESVLSKCLGCGHTRPFH